MVSYSRAALELSPDTPRPKPVGRGVGRSSHIAYRAGPYMTASNTNMIQSSGQLIEFCLNTAQSSTTVVE
jgi:hypothetical protein